MNVPTIIWIDEDGRIVHRTVATHEQLLRAALDPIRHHGRHDPDVLRTLAGMLTSLRSEIERLDLPGPVEPIDEWLAEMDEIDDPATALHEELVDAETDWEVVIGEAVEDEVKHALGELPDDFRAPLLLSCLGGLRYKEIAGALDVPVGTVMSRLFRARQRLRRSLREYAAERGLGEQAQPT